MKKDPVLLIAAGGTGGHMFPAQALAWEFEKEGWKVILITDPRGEKFSSTFPTSITKFVQTSATLKLNDPIGIPKAMIILLGSIIKSFCIFIELKPRAVIGFGGYPSFASLLVARVLNVKTVVHEQNAVLGRVNKLFSKRVNAVACSFWPTDAPVNAKKYFTGNPIRHDIMATHKITFDLPLTGILNLVVIGGSQGASFFSKVVPEAIECLPLKLKTRLRITQQARKEDCKKLENNYEKIGVDTTVEDFFQDIGTIFSRAHLIIARAGASTISEVLFFGKPLILIPIPNSFDDHQKINAQRVAQLGAAIQLDQENSTGKQLAEKINSILGNQNLAQKLAKKALRNSNPRAIIKLKEIVLKIAEGNIVEK